MKQDNRGLSLVELLVVIAIMAVVGGVGIWGVNTMTGRPAQQCAQKIVYSLERHRVTAAGKVDAKYVLELDSEKHVVLKEYVSNDGTFGAPTTSVIGAGSVRVSFVCGGNTYTLADNGPLELQFDRSSGSFKKQTADGRDGTYCTEIIVVSGGRSFEIELKPLTGKVSLR